MLLGRAAGGGGRIELAGAVPGGEGFDGGGVRWCGGADGGRMRWCGRHGWPADGNDGGLAIIGGDTAKLDGGDDSWGVIAVLLVGDGGVAGEGDGLRDVN